MIELWALLMVGQMVEGKVTKLVDAMDESMADKMADRKVACWVAYLAA
jgi:hypothetical protein